MMMVAISATSTSRRPNIYFKVFFTERAGRSLKPPNQSAASTINFHEIDEDVKEAYTLGCFSVLNII